jgi:uncharacterized protein (TIGR00369 family)
VDGHFRRLEAAYASAPVNRFHRPSLEVREGEATVAFEARPEFHHAAGAMHGSILFKALDDAAFFAANSLVGDRFLLTVSFTVHFFRPVVEGRLSAHGRVVHRTRRLLFAESVLLGPDGAELARGSGTFAPSAIPLDERVGYR